MFKQRLISGVILVILALIFIIQGGYLLLAVLGIISLIGLYELYRVFKIEKIVTGVVWIYRLGCVLSESRISFYPGYHAVCDGIADPVHVFVCILLSKISCKSDHRCIFRRILCVCDVVLHLSDQRASGRPLSCMANLPVFLGM